MRDGDAGGEEVRIRWNKAPSGTSLCSPPPSPTSGSFLGERVLFPPFSTTGSFTHSGLEPDTAYCYSVFVKQGGTYAPGRTVKGRPFDTTAGPVKWAYAILIPLIACGLIVHVLLHLWRYQAHR